MDYDDQEKEAAEEALKSNQLRDFDCPSCNANNPLDPPARNADELMCNYCGSEYELKLADGRIRFKEI